ncbi:MAG TPA: LacI family DNA-binding transcriptional regulator [Kiritimatiellia bacterium]|nr:LacI family DNA-binding transcriptional regulator [Kiritimatiellia bacterium]
MPRSRPASKSSDERASIYEVAKAAGVSIVTVSRAFNDYPHVSERMRRRVFEAARVVGYTPRLVTKRNALAIIVGHLDHISAGDYKTRLIQHLIRAAARAQYLVEFIPYDSADLATKNLVDGIIEVGLTQKEMDALAHLPDVPVVVINKRPRDRAWKMLASDHREEGFLAAEHLLARGHRRLALVLDELDGWGVENRRKGFEAALKRVRVKGRPLVFSAREQEPLAMARAIRDAGCTGCLNLSDNAGLAVLDSFINRLGLRIPEDLSVVCLENEAISPFFNPPLTTISQPLEELAASVIACIRDELAGRAVPAEQVFHSRLIQRASVRTIRARR